MTLAVLLSLIGVSFALSFVLTAVVKRVAIKVGFTDKPGHRKVHHVPKALGGGIAITWAFILPMTAALVWINLHEQPDVRSRTIKFVEDFATGNPKIDNPAPDELDAYWSGVQQQTPMALAFLGGCLALHVMGLFDDRRAMGPYSKLAIQLSVTIAVVLIGNLRILTALGEIPSIIITVLWITAISNAFNFLDNMDALSAGIAAVATVAFLITAVTIGQVFVAASLALLLGALIGFLCFNFPPASIFMGDSGSLVIGFILGVLTVRTTFLPKEADWQTGWYAVFAPVIVLAVPLYDLIVVSCIRLARGKSPFVGDTNHFSHRLVARGMSKRTAVLCLWLLTAATAIAAIILTQVRSGFGAMLIAAQTMLVLGVVMLLEQHPVKSPSDTEAQRHRESTGENKPSSP
jgi:UDP-GlcNAc:undecaprenyl-phosphate GlcNAc-1-phosphate transferase